MRRKFLKNSHLKSGGTYYNNLLRRRVELVYKKKWDGKLWEGGRWMDEWRERKRIFFLYQ